MIRIFNRTGVEKWGSKSYKKRWKKILSKFNRQLAKKHIKDEFKF